MAVGPSAQASACQTGASILAVALLAATITMLQGCVCIVPLCPLQIEKEVRAFSRTSGRSVRSCIVVGGVAMQEQRHDLRSGVEIVVATPGRFIDHLQQGNTSLDRISFVVLDEADRMLDMGFEPQVCDTAVHSGAQQARSGSDSRPTAYRSAQQGREVSRTNST